MDPSRSTVDCYLSEFEKTWSLDLDEKT
jgi:hypothetical protein